MHMATSSVCVELHIDAISVYDVVYSFLGNGLLWLNIMYSMPVQYPTLFLCTFSYSAVSPFQHLSCSVSYISIH